MTNYVSTAPTQADRGSDPPEKQKKSKAKMTFEPTYLQGCFVVCEKWLRKILSWRHITAKLLIFELQSQSQSQLSTFGIPPLAIAISPNFPPSVSLYRPRLPKPLYLQANAVALLSILLLPPGLPQSAKSVP